MRTLNINKENAEALYQEGNHLMFSWPASLEEAGFIQLEKGHRGAFFANLEPDIQIAAHYRLRSSGPYLSLVVKKAGRFLNEEEARKALGMPTKEVEQTALPSANALVLMDQNSASCGNKISMA